MKTSAQFTFIDICKQVSKTKRLILVNKVLILIVLIFSFAFSQEKDKKREKVTFGGKANIGIDFKAVGGLGGNAVNDSRLRRIGVVETEFKVLPAHNVELNFDLEFDHRFADINLQKLFVRYNFDNSNARFGFMKKMFTLENIKNSRERLISKKSMIHDVLEEWALLEKDFTLQYRYNFPSYTLIGGYSADGSNTHFVNLTALSKKMGNMRFVAAGMYYNYKDWGVSGERKNAFFGNAGMTFDGRITDFEIEGIWGTNLQNQVFVGQNYKLEYSENSDFGFWGLRFQESFPLELKRKHLNKIVPLYEISYLNTSTSLQKAYWQIRPAVNLCFTPKNRLQWRTNVDLVLTANNQESKWPQIISQRVTSQLFVMW